MSKTKLEGAIPTDSEIKADVWALANISPDLKGLEEAKKILAKYEKAVKYNMIRVLEKGKGPRDYFNILNNLEEKLQADLSDIVDIMQSPAFKQALISGLLHMVTSIKRKDLAITDYEGRQVANAADEQEITMMSELASLNDEEKGHKDKIQNAAMDAIRNMVAVVVPKNPESTALGEEHKNRLTRAEIAAIFIWKTVRNVFMACGIGDIDNNRFVTPPAKKALERIVREDKIRAQSIEALDLECPRTPAKTRVMMKSREI